MAEEEQINDEQEQKIKKLNEYVQQMAYKPVEPPTASKRTEALAQMKSSKIIGAYIEHKNDFEPRERSERVGRLVAKMQAMNTEQLGEFIKEHRKKQAKSELDRKQQQIVYHETLTKLHKQCEAQLMKSIVEKFAKEIATRATTLPPANVETESYERLQRSLVCNMFLALRIPQEQQAVGYEIYNKLASVLADLILQALFLAQNTTGSDRCTEKEIPQTKLPEDSEKDRCIKLRALRAAKKKLNHKRQKSARFTGAVPSHFY